MGITPAERFMLQKKAEELALGLPPLLVSAERVAASVLQGVHGRRCVGQGETFWQYRRFGPCDSASQIDWRQSARSGHVFVRETEWEAAQTVWLWVDTSASMEYRSLSALPTKLDRARLLLLALVVMLMRKGERFTLLGSGIAPATGRASLDRLMDALVSGNADLNKLPVTERLPQSAHVVLIGDFLGSIYRAREAVLGLAAQGICGQIVHLLDPAEIEFPFAGRVKFQGVDGEEACLVGRAQAMGSDYRRRLEAHQAVMREIARTAGWGIISHRTDASATSCLLSLFLSLAPRPGG